MRRILILMAVVSIFLSCQPGDTKNVAIIKAREDTLTSNRLFKPLWHVLTPIGDTQQDSLIFRPSLFKIIAYIEMNCLPCWQSSLQWKTRYYETCRRYPTVPLIVVLHGQPDQFAEMNKEPEKRHGGLQ